MKKILFIVVLFITNLISAAPLEYYSVEGKLIDSEKTPKFIQDTYFSEYKFFYTHSVSNEFYNQSTESGILAVIFQKFSNVPLFIIGVKVNIKDINPAIKSFDLNKYYNSSSFNYDIKKAVEERELTEELVYKIFGGKYERTESRSLLFLRYNYPKIYFTIKEGYVLDYIIFN